MTNILDGVKLPAKRATATITVTEPEIKEAIEEVIEALTELLESVKLPEVSVSAPVLPTPTPTLPTVNLPIKRDGLGLPDVSSHRLHEYRHKHVLTAPGFRSRRP